MNLRMSKYHGILEISTRGPSNLKGAEGILSLVSNVGVSGRVIFSVFNVGRAMVSRGEDRVDGRSVGVLYKLRFANRAEHMSMSSLVWPDRQRFEAKAMHNAVPGIHPDFLPVIWRLRYLKQLISVFFSNEKGHIGMHHICFQEV